MANTVTSSGGFLTIVLDGTTDFNSSTYFNAGVLLYSIKYIGATNDILVVRDGSASGPIISKMKDTTGGGVRDSIAGGRGIHCCPFVHAADGTITSGAVLIFETANY